MTKTFHQVQVGDPATIDGLKLVESKIQNPAPDEILVRVEASSLNFHDFAVVSGLLGPRPNVVPMSDGAGVVEAVGESVQDFSVGDRVISLFFPLWRGGEINASRMTVVPGDSTNGYASRYVTRPAAWFTRAPLGYSSAEAATLPCAALTAWRGLMVEARIKPGDWVVTQGTGGVSLFALQFSKAAGARVISTSSSDAKLEKLRELGADHVVNYRTTPDWGRAIEEITNGVGADVVVEIGGAGTLSESIRAVRIGGHISLIGVLTGWHGDVPTARLMGRNIHLKGITVGSNEQQLAMVAAIEANGIRPIIDRHFALGEIGAAFRHQESGQHFGKIVLDI